MPLAIATLERIRRGGLDGSTAVVVEPGQIATPGPTGITRFQHPASRHRRRRRPPLPQHGDQRRRRRGRPVVAHRPGRGGGDPR
ncbi:hypothetical protein [Leifsonia sp. NPDC058248]|uniref:hypothetical protein n=1 Tax=Leifsonia sp. NPDC058248 TaxID=3346402 RepID=UPI0036D8C168